MRLTPKPLIAILLLAVTALDAATPKKTEAELRALHDKIDKMTQQASRDALAHDRLSADLRGAELSLGQVRGELVRINRDYGDRSARRTALSQQRTQQQQRLDSERAALAGQMRAAYMIGQQEPLKLILNQRDPLASARLLTYYGYFGRARAEQMTLIESQVQHLDALDQQLEQEQTALENLKSSQQTQLQKLVGARDQRQKVLASLEAQSHSREQSLARLKAQQADLETLLRQLNSSLRTVPAPDTATAFGRLRGQLAWPVSGRITAAFGAVRASGVRWEGDVIATARSTPVKSVSAGRVVYADWLPGLGLLVIVDHGEGYLSLYGHNDRLFRATGESVSTGEAIAAAGDSGGRSEPELYFEIRRDGHPVDPGPWFKARAPDP